MQTTDWSNAAVDFNSNQNSFSPEQQTTALLSFQMSFLVALDEVSQFYYTTKHLRYVFSCLPKAIIP